MKKDVDKNRLVKVIESKIVTTMIGSLAAIEEGFKDVWDEEHAYIYEEVRKRILDLGNKQSHQVADELDKYDVKWNRFTITLPVVERGGFRNE